MDSVAKPESRYDKVSSLTSIVLVIFHGLAFYAAFWQFSWTNLIVAAFLLLGGRRPGHQHGLSPAAHASRLQDAEGSSSISWRSAAP